MTHPLTEAEFSIIRGGLLERFLIFTKITSHGKAHTGRKIIFFVVICWLPLLVLSAIEGLLVGEKVQIPFLHEFATHFRLLLAIPLMLISEVIVDTRVKLTLGQFTRAGLLTESGKEKFELAKQKADRMCESVLPEVIILALIVVNLAFRFVTKPAVTTTWLFPDVADTNALSIAGQWAIFVSYPLFQFLAFRWLWRWVIWFRLLFLISKAGLRLYTAHPDKAGGLGFLGEPPAVFAPITLMLGVVFASTIGERLVYMGVKLNEHYALIAAFALIAIVMNVLPLLVFVPRMARIRREGIYSYSTLIAHHHRGFEDKWIQSKDDEAILGNPDPSSTADLGITYEYVKQMRPFPFDIKIMLGSIVASLLPLLPVVALEIPIVEILKALVKVLM